MTVPAEQTAAPATIPGAAVDAATGRLDGATNHYVKRVADLAGVFAEEAAFAARLAAAADDIVYAVYEARRSGAAGDLSFGTSIVEPGRVGREFHMTRGHLHKLVDRAEIYYCLRGTGVLLIENIAGDTTSIEVRPGSVAYVPPGHIHRSVNVGDKRLITLFCYPADAGHDYDAVAAARGMRVLVVDDGTAGWALVPNPRYIQRNG